jgi:glucokinase
MEKLALGIDIGGTNIAFGIGDIYGKIIYENSIPTKTFDKFEDLCSTIFNEPNITCNINNIIGIGIGAPNGNHFTGEIQFAPNLPWKGVIKAKQIFESIFSKKTILTNDANAAAEGEKLFGAAKNFKNFVEITLGTGLGSGIYIDDKIVYGANGIAGEFGHIRIVPNGRHCNCKRNGCLESYASSTGIVKSFYELDHPTKNKSLLNNLKEITAKEIFNHAQIHKDEFSTYIIDYTAEVLGSALADFACFSDPEAYILFGGIAQSGQYFSEKVKFHLEKNLLNIYKDKIQVLTSQLHDKNAAILGNIASVFKLNLS